MSRHEHRHLSIHIRPVRRHEGDSFARQVAYIGRTTQLDPRTGVRYDFSGSENEEIESKGIVGWAGDIDSLVAAAAFAEPRRRSKVVEGRMAILALPVEFTATERRKAVKSCAQYLVATFGVAVAAAIHRPPKGGDRRNWHTHLLFTSRVVEAGAALGAKTRALDTLKTGPKLIEAFRVWWCGKLNSMLLEAGHAVTIEHKSFARMGVQEEPSCHEGEKRTAISRRRELDAKWTPLPLPQPKFLSGIVPGNNSAVQNPETESSAGDMASGGGLLLPVTQTFRPLPAAPVIKAPTLEPVG